jgi:hypothetical protein
MKQLPQKNSLNKGLLPRESENKLSEKESKSTMPAILVVDDDPDFVEVVCAIPKKKDYEVS